MKNSDLHLMAAVAKRSGYWIELATLEKALLALDPISRIVPTTRTRITASITAYSAISCPASSDQILRINLDILSLQSIHLSPLDGRSAIDAPHNAPPCTPCQSRKCMKNTVPNPQCRKPTGNRHPPTANSSALQSSRPLPPHPPLHPRPLPVEPL